MTDGTLVKKRRAKYFLGVCVLFYSCLTVCMCMRVSLLGENSMTLAEQRDEISDTWHEQEIAWCYFGSCLGLVTIR